jgi:outer membrane protein
MKKSALLKILVLVLLSIQAQAFATDQEQIYIVDLPRIVTESKLGKSAQIKMRAKAEEAQANMAKVAQELRAQEEKLQKQSSVLSANALNQQREDLVRRQKDFAREGEDKQAELQNQNRKYMTDVLKEIKLVLEQLGKEKNYPIIIERDQKLVLYVDSKIDITAEVIQKLDAKKSSL